MDKDDKLIQKMLEDMGLTNLPEDKKDELIAKMAEVVLRRMYVAAIDELGAENQETYGEMLDKEAAPEEIEKFLREKISNYEQKMEKVMLDFKREMMNEAENGAYSQIEK